MDEALQRLYQELILDHNAHPRNFGPLAEATHRADGHNPMCGDQLTLRLQLRDGRIAKIRCEAQGCAISRASASLMGAAIEGRPEAEARALFAAFHQLVTEQLDDDDDDDDAADKDMLSHGHVASHAQAQRADAAATDAAEADDDDDDALDDPAMLKLQALAGVRAFPMRVKCATLAWHTLISALAGQASVTTDDDPKE